MSSADTHAVTRDGVVIFVGSARLARQFAKKEQRKGGKVYTWVKSGVRVGEKLNGQA